MGDKIEISLCLEPELIEKEFECLSHECRRFRPHKGIASKVCNPANPLPSSRSHDLLKLPFTYCKNVINLSRVSYNRIRKNKGNSIYPWFVGDVYALLIMLNSAIPRSDYLGLFVCVSGVVRGRRQSRSAIICIPMIKTHLRRQ